MKAKKRTKTRPEPKYELTPRKYGHNYDARKMRQYLVRFRDRTVIVWASHSWTATHIAYTTYPECYGHWYGTKWNRKPFKIPNPFLDAARAG